MLLFVFGGVGGPMPSGLCELYTRSPSPQTLEIRNKLGRIEGFGSCALVGSSGLLLRTRVGAEIDSHELVIRTNLSPVGGYEPIVGKRTSLRVMNSEALDVALTERACEELRAERDPCPDYSIHINSGNAEAALRYTLAQACPGLQTLGRFDLCTAKVKVGPGAGKLPDTRASHCDDPVIRLFTRRFSGSVMTGAWALALAMHACPNGVDLFGFTHAATTEMGAATPYHYYDKETIRGHDSLNASAAALTRLTEQQPGCVRVHTPSELSEPFVRDSTNERSPHARAFRADPLVDGLRREFPRQLYARGARCGKGCGWRRVNVTTGPWMCPKLPSRGAGSTTTWCHKLGANGRYCGIGMPHLQYDPRLNLDRWGHPRKPEREGRGRGKAW